MPEKELRLLELCRKVVFIAPARHGLPCKMRHRVRAWLNQISLHKKSILDGEIVE